MRRTNNCLYVGKDIKLEYKSLNRFCLFINELKFLLKWIVDEFFEWQSCKKFHKWFLTKICSKEEQNCTILAEFNCKGAQITLRGPIIVHRMINFCSKRLRIGRIRLESQMRHVQRGFK